MKKACRSNLFYGYIILILLFTFPFVTVSSQAKRNKTWESYVDTYKYIAIDHMKKHKIPASITLAQGLLESGAGNSDLATKGKNHFGIKCHPTWTGKRMYKADDLPNDCFRVYNSAEDSYEDHALFLKRDRYSSLFKLDITDYPAWARGLQQCGYATDKAYANKLIKIIEDYELYLHDNTAIGKGPIVIDNIVVPKYAHTPYKTHNLIYVEAKNGDTYEAIATEFQFKAKDLYKYNEVPKGFPLKDGDIVYFQDKKKKADKPYTQHIIKVGESMHSISQKYGIKVKNLYKMNKKDYEYVPVEGDILKLR
ncbi:MAG: glucosaminidase domain-containing protein [Prevotella sp.]|jgi:LysM repeat protein|nr:glucosaminidase domain-containing protein [Prevotella sp.]